MQRRCIFYLFFKINFTITSIFFKYKQQTLGREKGRLIASPSAPPNPVPHLLSSVAEYLLQPLLPLPSLGDHTDLSLQTSFLLPIALTQTQFQQSFSGKPQASQAREADRLTAEFHLSLNSSKSNPQSHLSLLSKVPATNSHSQSIPPPVDHIKLHLHYSIPFLIPLSQPLILAGIPWEHFSHKSSRKSGALGKTKSMKNKNRGTKRNISQMPKNIFNKIREEKFPNIKKNMPIKIQVAYKKPNRLDKKRKSP